MPRQITPRTTLDNLKAEAKRWLRALRAGDALARERLARVLAGVPAPVALRDVQRALALEHGLDSWTTLKQELVRHAPRRHYEKVAEALVTAYRTADASAMRIIWDYFGHMRAWAGMRRYVRLDLGKHEQPESGEADEITLAEAQLLVARAQDFESWNALTAFAASVTAQAPTLAAKAVALLADADATSRTVLTRSRDWDTVMATLLERRLPGLDASGQMTDALLERLSHIGHLTTLDLGGSRALSDDGLHHLRRLPALRHLNLGGCGITDRGLEVLRYLPALESISLAWTPITDAGMPALSACDSLRSVDLSWTHTGDGGIRALAGKAHLHHFRSGNAVTDAGLPLLHELPVFARWHGGEPTMTLRGYDAGPNYLLLRGTFSDAGLARLAGLDGLFALNMDNDRLAVTGAGLAPLVDHLPRLGWLAFDAKDDAMPVIAAFPRLQSLMCQDTVASDEGFVALSRSRSIEYIWGRRCHNLRRRGFVALAEMPALKALSVSCLNVDDVGLSALPDFPALRELMPMDVPDEGYRHVGRCARLDSLVLMYCRETTDVATQHIAGLPALQKYFASYNRITDRTPEILAGMATLEDVTFDTCAGLTNAGVAALARLPRLRALGLSGMPTVTRAVVSAFDARVQVRHAV